MTDPDYMTRVLALLAKAESTEFAEEAEAFFAKAQELMARHAIDEAMLAAAGRRAGDQVGSRTFDIEAPYASAKSSLLGSIANVNGAKAVRLPTRGGTSRVVVYGFPADLDNVEQLFAALLLHATRSVLAEAIPPGDTPRRFRHAFFESYAVRIWARLYDARQVAVGEYESETGTSTAVVLADRTALVDEAFKAANPHTRPRRATVSSRSGAVRGKAAADAADLGQARLGGPSREALER